MHLVWSDERGVIYDAPTWQAVGRSGFWKYPWSSYPSWIPLPEGSTLFHLVGRHPIGISPKGELRVYEKGWAVAAFIAPAHTQLASAAYEKVSNAPTLPLYAYTAVGWKNGRFYVPAVRIDPQPRQDIRHFDPLAINRGAEKLRKRFPSNRLVAHLLDNCVERYCCPAARNLALGRWECPLPTSPACNAACIGCISLQEKHESPIPSSQERLSFIPTPEEIAELAVYHLNHAPAPIVSFGQGCEGEPLLVWRTIEEAVRLIRRKTPRGIINLNTNGAWPDIIERLAHAGIDSFRISMNSAQPAWYERYYRPRNYSFAMVKESIRRATSMGKWVSINYFILPGFTDQPTEVSALYQLIQETGLHMIQWRNFNIDPDWYIERMQLCMGNLQPPIGIYALMRQLKRDFPRLKFGYFNPTEKFIRQHITPLPASQGNTKCTV
ncbi:MAG: radical SAM protein [Bacteroidia bacterium]|nr:radical SAM protein [Bacteroidia bacterium]MCX7652250.1 radical SAM protein [Bacteroidia bacterium]MDW8416512.1 radical SAM protein [Bacteroidia bacterium]